MRIVYIAIILAAVFHLYGFAKENGNRFPETQRFAKEMATLIAYKYEQGLTKGLEALESRLSNNQEINPGKVMNSSAQQRFEVLQLQDEIIDSIKVNQTELDVSFQNSECQRAEIIEKLAAIGEALN